MSFRDPLQAAQARIAALEAEVTLLRQQRPVTLATGIEGEALRRALEGQAEAERQAASALRELATVRAKCQVELAESTHESALAAAQDEADDARQDATHQTERGQLERELELRTAELAQLTKQTGARISELEDDLEALLSFDRADARAHYQQRADDLRAVRAVAERSIAELQVEGAKVVDAGTAAANEAILAAGADRVARLDGELQRLEALIARIRGHAGSC